MKEESFKRSWVQILSPDTGRPFFTLICFKFMLVVWKDRNKRKRGRRWPFKIRKYYSYMETANLNWLQIKIMVPINHPLLLLYSIRFAHIRLSRRICLSAKFIFCVSGLSSLSSSFAFPCFACQNRPKKVSDVTVAKKYLEISSIFKFFHRIPRHRLTSLR